MVGASALEIGVSEYCSANVLAKAANSRISAYDAEFVVTAEELGAQVVTSDRQILDSFPLIAISPEDFLKTR